MIHPFPAKIEDLYVPNGHQLIHIITIVLAVCLVGIALISYRRNGRGKLLLLAGAFLGIFIKEFIIYLETFHSISTAFSIFMSVPLDHVINFLILLLFSIGILKR